MCERQTPIDVNLSMTSALTAFSKTHRMATFTAVKKAVTLTPTVRTLPNGIPYAPLLNLVAKAPHDPHSHSTTVRSDSAPRWAGGILRPYSRQFSKTFTTGHLFFSSVSFPISNFWFYS